MTREPSLTKPGHDLRRKLVRDGMDPYEAFKKALAEQPKKTKRGKK